MSNQLRGLLPAAGGCSFAEEAAAGPCIPRKGKLVSSARALANLAKKGPHYTEGHHSELFCSSLCRPVRSGTGVGSFEPAPPHAPCVPPSQTGSIRPPASSKCACVAAKKGFSWPLQCAERAAGLYLSVLPWNGAALEVPNLPEQGQPHQRD